MSRERPRSYNPYSEISQEISVDIICADALRALDTIMDDSFDCVVTDPPYGATQNKWDKALPCDKLMQELLRVSSGAVVITATQPFASDVISAAKKYFKHEWIWYKNKGSGHLNCKTSPLRYHENIIVFAKTTYVFNPQMTDGHKPGNYAKRTKSSPNYGTQRDSEYGGSTLRYPRSVQEITVVNNDSPDRIHNTQKPVELFDYLIRTYSRAGDRILDPFAGSGTTAVAAKQCGRSATLVEINSEYCDLISKRIRT